MTEVQFYYTATSPTFAIQKNHCGLWGWLHSLHPTCLLLGKIYDLMYDLWSASTIKPPPGLMTQ